MLCLTLVYKRIERMRAGMACVLAAAREEFCLWRRVPDLSKPTAIAANAGPAHALCLGPGESNEASGDLSASRHQRFRLLCLRLPVILLWQARQRASLGRQPVLVKGFKSSGFVLGLLGSCGDEVFGFSGI